MEKTLKLYKLPPTEKTINVIGVGSDYPSDFPTVFKENDYFLQISSELPTANCALWYADGNSDSQTPGEWVPCSFEVGKYYRDTSIPLSEIDTPKIYACGTSFIISEYTDTLFPQDDDAQAEIFDFTYNASRMGNAPTISATLYNKRCLDDDFQDPVFTIFGGNVFVVDKTPTISISNTESNKGYKHEITFVSDRIILEHLYFFDVVYQGDNATQDHPCSNNTTFSFYGRIDQFAQRLRNSLAYHGILNETSGFTVVIDDDVNYTDPTQNDFVDENLISFEDKTMLEALNEMFSVYEVPYYFVGHTIHIGYFNQHDWTESFEYGYDNSLLSVKKSNTTSKLIDICSGWGSEENIPYFYPNFTPNGIVPIYHHNNGTETEDVIISNPYKLSNCSTSVYDDIQGTWIFGTKFLYNLVPRIYKMNTTYLGGTHYDEITAVRIATDYGDNFLFSENLSEGGMQSVVSGQNTLVWFKKTIKVKIRNSSWVTQDGMYFKLRLFYMDEFLGTGYNQHDMPPIPEIRITCMQEPAEYGYAMPSWAVSNYTVQNINLVNGTIYEIEGYVPIWSNIYVNQYVKFDILYRYYNGAYTWPNDHYTQTYDLQTGELIWVQTPHTDFPYNDFVYHNEIEITAKGYVNSWTSIIQNEQQQEEAIEIFGLGNYGIRVANTPQIGDYIYFVQRDFIPYTTRLCPPIYRRTLGERLFYEAKNYPFPLPSGHPVDADMGEAVVSGNVINQSYTNSNGVNYVFENEYDETRPHQHVGRFDDIKPTIKGITNTQGLRIDMFSEFAYDLNDSDAKREDGQYIHPYFYGKLRKTDHSSGLGFNLFDCATDGGRMTFSMTSGSCGGCNFEIRVDSSGVNTVVVDEQGNLQRWTEEETNDPDIIGNVKLGGNIARQQDTENYEVWVCLAKDYETYGVLMPNAQNLYRPRGDNWDANAQNPVSNNGDTFVILNINLPSTYVAAAEERLMREIIKHMYENNMEKFSYSLSLSKIFYAENNTSLQLDAYLNESAKVPIVYADDNIDDIYYVSSFTYKMASTSSQPDVTLELKDKFKRKRRFSEIINQQPAVPTSRDDMSGGTQMPTPDLQTTIPNLVVTGEILIGEDSISVGDQIERNANEIASIQQSDTKEKIWGQIGSRAEVKNMFVDGTFLNDTNTFDVSHVKNITTSSKGGLTKEKCVSVTFDKDTDAVLEFNQYIPCNDSKIYTAAIMQSLVGESENVDAVMSITYFKGDKTEISTDTRNIQLTTDWDYVIQRIQPAIASQYMRIAITVSRDSDTSLKIDSVHVLDGDYADTTLPVTEPSSLFPTKFVKNENDDTSYADNSVKKFHADKVGEMYEDISESGAEVSVINGLDVEKYYYCNLTESSLTRTILLNSSINGVATHVLFLNPSNQQKTLTLVGNIVGNMNIISNENPISIPATSYRLITFYKHPSIYFCHAENACTYQNLSVSNYFFCIPQKLTIGKEETKILSIVSDMYWDAALDQQDTISLSQDSGTGSGHVNVTSNYSGRENTTNSILIGSSSMAIEIPVTIKGKDEFVRFTELGYTTENKTATLNVTGVSNSKRLTFYIEGVNNEMIVVPQSYTADGNTTQNGAEITGDPGSEAEYSFSISIAVDIDSDVNEDVTCVLCIDADTFGIYDKCTIGYIEPRKTFNIIGKYNSTNTTHHLLGRKDQSGNFIILGNKQ